MTRPIIIRADTIDLQDQDSPSAAEHHRPVLQGGIAPHQRAEVHHVLEERHSEENALADAWKMSDDLTEEPDAIDEAQQQRQTIDHSTANGIFHDANEENGDMGGAEADADDDMMDRISSSPSIDDGGYTPCTASSPLPSTPCRSELWPARKSSLSPSHLDTPTPPGKSLNYSAASPSSTDSSPFWRTPQHLPLRVRRTGRAVSPLLSEPDWSSSPYRSSPKHVPWKSAKKYPKLSTFTSEHHQNMGRYNPELDRKRDLDVRTNSEMGNVTVRHKAKQQIDRSRIDPQHSTSSHAQGHSSSASDRTGYESPKQHRRHHATVDPIESPFRRHSWTRSNADLSQARYDSSTSLKSTASIDLEDLLLPVDDPLLETPPSPTDSSGSWESLGTISEDSLEDGAKEHDDDTDALFDSLDDRFIDSGWGGECLRETEDINFEFVYALHTFVATVEGQANATKGDTMVLLDDSNSYWWLVRVVKDSSIGYLPAEHIETPTERLARLNKHRNIDLSATMLSDNKEVSRNPLRKLAKKSKKNVQFSAPTYFSPRIPPYVDDDEDADITEGDLDDLQSEDAEPNGESTEEVEAEDDKIEQSENARAFASNNRGSFDREQAATVVGQEIDELQTSPKYADNTEAAPLKSRKTRNTDSFLKDDSIETRKITITPGLLREESSGKTSSSSEVVRNDSLESIVKAAAPAELTKKDSKKEKEKDKKKDGIFKGFFKSKKKDKKGKDEIETPEDDGLSERFQESPVVSPLGSGRNSPGEPRQDSSSIRSALDSRAMEIQGRPVSRDSKSAEQSEPAPAELQGAEVAHEMAQPPMLDTALGPPEKAKDPSPLSPITNLLKRDDTGKTAKPTKAKRAKDRVMLDDFDSPTDEEAPFDEQVQREASLDEGDTGDRLSESPVEVSPDTFMHGTEIVHIPTPSPYDQPGVDANAEEDNTEGDEDPESMTTSPSIIEHPSEPTEESEADTRTPGQDSDDSTPRGPRSPGAIATEPTKPSTPPPPMNRGISTDSFNTPSWASKRTTPSSSQTESVQSWDDNSLRTWLDDGSEIKDMMIMIHDTSDAMPVGEDHPMMAGLFTEQKKGVQGMMDELDGLLGSFLTRKGITFA